MAKRVVYLHTVLGVIPLFDELSRELLPTGTEVWHVADEIMAKVILAQRQLSPFIYSRVADHVRAAAHAGADIIQLTCSSISPCAGVAAKMVDVPVLTIDEPMVELALAAGTRIGVAATAVTALTPLANLVSARGQAAGKQVEVETLLCEEAYSYMVDGNRETHDRIVREAVEEIAQRSDAVLLAQASMARAVETLRVSVPILTSPRPALERLRQRLAALG